MTNFLALYNALVRSVLEYGSLVWSHTAANIYRIDRVLNRFYASLIFAPIFLTRYMITDLLIKLLNSIPSHLDTKFGIHFIHGLIEGCVDVPRLLDLLDFLIPSNTSFQGSYPSNHKHNFSKNAPLSWYVMQIYLITFSTVVHI